MPNSSQQQSIYKSQQLRAVELPTQSLTQGWVLIQLEGTRRVLDTAVHSPVLWGELLSFRSAGAVRWYENFMVLNWLEKEQGGGGGGGGGLKPSRALRGLFSCILMAKMGSLTTPGHRLEVSYWFLEVTPPLLSAAVDS